MRAEDEQKLIQLIRDHRDAGEWPVALFLSLCFMSTTICVGERKQCYRGQRKHPIGRSSSLLPWAYAFCTKYLADVVMKQVVRFDKFDTIDLKVGKVMGQESEGMPLGAKIR